MLGFQNNRKSYNNFFLAEQKCIQGYDGFLKGLPNFNWKQNSESIFYKTKLCRKIDCKRFLILNQVLKYYIWQEHDYFKDGIVFKFRISSRKWKCQIWKLIFNSKVKLSKTIRMQLNYGKVALVTILFEFVRIHILPSYR